ncbi:MAG: hypothetical protein U1E27_00410 [Kiritimatiellia bacterium]|nr:hypothetical protein [Kiritimatiellia bacterium]
MSFESGSVSFSMFYLSTSLPGDSVERFAREAAPPLTSLGDDPAVGWVGGRHLLDLPITEENARFGGYLRLTLLQALRKVPPALFRAHVALEELAWMKAEGKPFVPRRERADIRRDVMARLLPDMPPQLRGIRLVVDETARLAYSDALSPAQQDLLRAYVLRTTGIELIAVTPATAAAARRKVDVRDWGRTSFSAEVPADRVSEEPGHDFLTWLWYFCEAHGGIFKDEEHGDFALALDGPLMFSMEGDGAHETVLRKGAPIQSVEARACLLSGKKLRQARLTLGRPDESWTFSFSSDSFAFRGMKIPEENPPPMDPAGRFQDRLLRLAVFRDVFLRLFDRFIDERNGPKRWEGVAEEMREWARSRPTRR